MQSVYFKLNHHKQTHYNISFVLNQRTLHMENRQGQQSIEDKDCILLVLFMQDLASA
jgi:hypothetical protein